MLNGQFEVFPMILLANLGVGYKFNPIKIFISDKRDENFKLHWQVVQSFGAPASLIERIVLFPYSYIFNSNLTVARIGLFN